MKLAAGIMIGIGLALFAWSLSRLTSDAVALALGLTLGVLAGVPCAALVIVAARRDSEDDDDAGAYIDAPVTYADQVTPYYRAARQAMNMPPLPDRQAQISELEAYLDHLKTQRDPRQFVVRWESEVQR